MKFLFTHLLFSLFPSIVSSWVTIQPQSIQLLQRRPDHHSSSLIRLAESSSSSSSSSDGGGGDKELPDFNGKKIYQRTFYRLSPGSQVSKPHALLLEERLRFQADPERPDYILPTGPRTYIFRKGTSEDEITNALYRFDFGTTHNGPGTMDDDIATILYMAAEAKVIQGDVLQLACESGVVGVMGCMAARLALGQLGQKMTGDGGADAGDLLTMQKHENVFPDKMHHLTLSDEGEDSLRGAYETAKHFSNEQISLKDVRWRTRNPPGRRYDHYYRTIIGSDIDFEYPDSKNLARTVANYLLPSNELAVMSTRDGASTSNSFGGLGMDMDSPSPSPNDSDEDTMVDPSVPPTFIHVAPDVRENLRYLRQFLEKGFRMTVDTGFMNLERLNFVYQTLDAEADEAELEDLDTLELRDDSSRGYQFVKAIHHYDYAGEGSGEYFFPLETGEYEGGSRNTWLEPEEGGSVM